MTITPNSERRCTIDGCAKPIEARRMCAMHYTRWFRHGDPTVCLTVHHGLSRFPEYEVWRKMVYRCENANHVAYRHYGGRGIRVCERWRRSFPTFLADMGPRPSPAHKIDRINNDGNYKPGNCRWATQTEQARNTQRTRRLTAFGETLCVTEWAERTGIQSVTIQSRLRRGWTVEETLTRDVRRRRHAVRSYRKAKQ